MSISRINLLAWAIMSWTLAGVILVAGCATTAGGRQADYAVHADHASTITALTVVDHAAEVNPLAPLGPLRYALHRNLEAERCAARWPLKWSTAIGAGAAANNLLVIAGASWHPVALLAAIPAYLLHAGCEPHLLPAHGATLAAWERAYEAGSAEELAALMDNDELLARYAAFFERTEQRDVVYTRTESVRGGFITDYRATLTQTGEAVTQTGEMHFHLGDGATITAIDQHRTPSPEPRPS